CIPTRNPLSRLIPQFKLRTAIPAGIGLRVKAPIEGIVIFRLAPRAHGKYRHRRTCAVIRNIAHDSEPRTAISAVDKRIAIPAVGNITHFPQTIRTDGHVGRDQGAHLLAATALQDAEIGFRATRHILYIDLCDVGQGRRFPAQPLHEIVDGLLMALNFDSYSGGRVPDMSSELVANRKPVYIGTESHALHDP